MYVPVETILKMMEDPNKSGEGKSMGPSEDSSSSTWTGSVITFFVSGGRVSVADDSSFFSGSVGSSERHSKPVVL